MVTSLVDYCLREKVSMTHSPPGRAEGFDEQAKTAPGGQPRLKNKIEYGASDYTGQAVLKLMDKPQDRKERTYGKR